MIKQQKVVSVNVNEISTTYVSIRCPYCSELCIGRAKNIEETAEFVRKCTHADDFGFNELAHCWVMMFNEPNELTG